MAVDPGRAHAKSKHHLQVRQDLLAEKAKTRALQQQLSALAIEYRKTRAMLQKSQLANSMLRRVFGRERDRKFHLWLELLERKQPGRLFSILHASYRYLDSRTCIQHRAVCAKFLEFAPAYCTVVKLSMRQPARLDERGLRRLVGSLSGALEASFAGFERPADARLFCSSSSGLANCHNLISLDLSRSCIGSRAAADLGKHGNFPSLEILRLEGNGLRSEGLDGLFGNGRALGVRCLRYLYLPDNLLQQDCEGKYCDRGLISLGRAMEGAGCSDLEVIDLSRNFVDDGGIHAIAAGLARCTRLRVFRAQWDGPRGSPPRECSETGGVRNGGAAPRGKAQAWGRMRRKNSARSQTLHGISDTGALELARSIARIVSAQRDLLASRRLGSGPLETVDLRSHRIGNAGCTALIESILSGGSLGGSGTGTARSRRGVELADEARGRGTVSRSDTHRRNAERSGPEEEEEEKGGAPNSAPKPHRESTRLLLHGNPTIGAGVIETVARRVGLGGQSSFQSMDTLREMFGIFEPHVFEEEENVRPGRANSGRDAASGTLADDFSLQVRAAVARRRESARIAAAERAAAERTARFRRAARQTRLPLLPALN